MLKKVSLSSQNLSLSEINAYYADSKRALKIYFSSHSFDEVHPQYKGFISELITAFKYRHWLAHGRYWEPKLGRIYDYYSLYDLAYEMENLLTSLNEK